MDSMVETGSQSQVETSKTGGTRKFKSQSEIETSKTGGNRKFKSQSEIETHCSDQDLQGHLDLRSFTSKTGGYRLV
jgi:hypothetical protein